MPDQSESGLPPSSPPPSSSSADPGNRSNRASHLSSCDAPGSSQPRSIDISSGQPSSPYTYDEISIAVAQSSVSRADMDGLPPVSSSSGSHGGNMASRNNIDASDMDIAAFTALSQFPIVGDDPDFLAVSEVVNAVMEGQEYMRNEDSGNNAAPEIASPSHLGNLYMSEPGRNDALGLGAVPIGAYLDGADLGMETIFHQLMNNLAVGHGRLSDDSDEDDDEGDLVMDYESPVPGGESTPLSVQEEDPDDTQKFYMDDDNEYYDDYTNHSQTREGAGQLSDVDFDDFYRSFDLDAFSQMTEVAVAGTNDDHNNYFSDGEDTNAGEQGTEAHFPASVVHGTTHERNFNIDQFIAQWLVQASSTSIPSLPRLSSASPLHPISNILGWIPPETTIRPQRCAREFYDVQQIPWWDALRVKRSDARALRDLWYTSYHNLDYSQQRPGLKLPQEEFYFREKSMHTRCRATIEHFQLRNLMSVPAYKTVHFSHESKVYSWVPGYDDLSCLIDLSKPPVESGFQGSVKISTMKSAHNVCIAGGFTGEYALHSASMEGGGVQGYVTKDLNGITNHIDIVPSRSSRSPMGIFASNDRHLRVLDCETNTFITDHELSRAINCTSTSPDGRLRVVIGDSPDAWIIEADTGRPVHPLRGHRDFGFACAWSPDMRHIATSNQDKTVIIWDARTWRILETIESDVAGYRSVRFSPVGGGPRTLLLCEPADRIAIVNAQTYKSRQVHDFFGEIGGADFSPDGSTIWVANTDEHFGGFMEFDRRQWGQQYGPRGLPNEWVRESDLDDDERCVLSERERQMRFWWNLSNEEHEALLL